MFLQLFGLRTVGTGLLVVCKSIKIISRESVKVNFLNT